MRRARQHSAPLASPPTVAAPAPHAAPRSFLGGLTGRAGLAQLSDTFVSDPHLFFTEGQSVRAAVVAVEPGKDRFSVALKQSLCGSRDASLLASLFRCWGRGNRWRGGRGGREK